MVCHAHVMRLVEAKKKGSKLSFGDRQRFFSSVRYQMGREHTLSLDEIEHGILRNNSAGVGLLSMIKGRPFSESDERRRWAVELDPRVHFALNCGAVSCPALEYFTADAIDEMLTVAAEAFVDSSVRVLERDAGKATLQLPKLLDWYAKDFGKTPADVLERLVALVPQAHVTRALQGVLDEHRTKPDKHSIKFQFAAYDWSIFNRPGIKFDDEEGE